MANKPANLPEEAVELYDVYDQYAPRLIDKLQSGYRVLGRFRNAEMAAELLAIKNAIRPYNQCTQYTIWGVVVDGMGYALQTDKNPVPVMRSARAATLAMLSEAERACLKLVVPPPNVYQSAVQTLYDLSMPHQNYQTQVARFFEREEAEKWASCRPDRTPFIAEVKCYVSGDMSYAIQPEPFKISTSLAEALLEEIAPEFRALLDI